MTLGADSATADYEGSEVPVPGTYDLDSTRSYAGFSVRHHLVSSIRGQFRSFRGTVTVAEDPSFSGVLVEIDAASLDTGDGPLDAYVRSADFLDVDRYPTITYRSDSVLPVVEWFPDGRDRWHVQGDLALHGVVRPVDLEVRFEGGLIDPHGAARVGFTAHAAIVRDDFGLTWDPVMETDDAMIGREVTVELEIEAVRRT